MQWTVVRAAEGFFLTSDAPVVRHDTDFKGGFYGGGLFSSTAEVWFPLSKQACIAITHDHAGEKKFFKLLAAGRREEAKAVKREVPPTQEVRIKKSAVDRINNFTIANADRFVFSPFESIEISKGLQGKSQNMRMVSSPPPPIRKKSDPQSA